MAPGKSSLGPVRHLNSRSFTDDVRLQLERMERGTAKKRFNDTASRSIFRQALARKIERASGQIDFRGLCDDTPAAATSGCGGGSSSSSSAATGSHSRRVSVASLAGGGGEGVGAEVGREEGCAARRRLAVARRYEEKAWAATHSCSRYGMRSVPRGVDKVDDWEDSDDDVGDPNIQDRLKLWQPVSGTNAADRLGQSRGTKRISGTFTGTIDTSVLPIAEDADPLRESMVSKAGSSRFGRSTSRFRGPSRKLAAKSVAAATSVVGLWHSLNAK